MRKLLWEKDEKEIERSTGERKKEWPNSVACHINGNGLWVMEYENGQFHTIEGNADELFDKLEDAFKWLEKRML